jgi:hypothetical protein
MTRSERPPASLDLTRLTFHRLPVPRSNVDHLARSSWRGPARPSIARRKSSPSSLLILLEEQSQCGVLGSLRLESPELDQRCLVVGIGLSPQVLSDGQLAGVGIACPDRLGRLAKEEPVDLQALLERLALLRRLGALLERGSRCGLPGMPLAGPATGPSSSVSPTSERGYSAGPPAAQESRCPARRSPQPLR